jgi:hypothetical protein
VVQDDIALGGQRRRVSRGADRGGVVSGERVVRFVSCSTRRSKSVALFVLHECM